MLVALLKQQGVDVKGAPKGSLVSEEIPPLIEGNEKLEVCLIVLLSCSKLQSNFNIIVSWSLSLGNMLSGLAHQWQRKDPNS